MCELIEKLRIDIDGAFDKFADGNESLTRIEIRDPDTYRLLVAMFDVAYTMGRQDQVAVDVATLHQIGMEKPIT